MLSLIQCSDPKVWIQSSFRQNFASRMSHTVDVIESLAHPEHIWYSSYRQDIYIGIIFISGRCRYLDSKPLSADSNIRMIILCIPSWGYGLLHIKNIMNSTGEKFVSPYPLSRNRWVSGFSPSIFHSIFPYPVIYSSPTSGTWWKSLHLLLAAILAEP